jgi:hypothetical protein
MLAKALRALAEVCDCSRERTRRKFCINRCKFMNNAIFGDVTSCSLCANYFFAACVGC